MAFPASIKTELTEQRVEKRTSTQTSAPSVPWLSGYALDPRPDLTDDHWYWVAVLAEAWMQEHRGEMVLIEPGGGYDADTAKRNDGPAAERTGPEQRNPERTSPTDPISSSGRSFYGLLHGLRCGGARLQRQRTRAGKEFLRLDYKPLLGPGSWNEDKLLKDWLEPAKDQMKECFEKALATYEAWQDFRAERVVGVAARGMTAGTEAAEALGQNRGQGARESNRENKVAINETIVPEPIQGSLFRPA